MLLPQEIIRRKRDGQSLPAQALTDFIAGVVDGSVSEGQIAAWAMAVYFHDLDTAERIALTRAMTESGTVIDWSQQGIDRPLVDKHSTGGVGDKVSLILAPLVTACGAAVPMISGRGLGHTGGTLDKLDSIPGYDTRPGLAALGRVVREVGCAIVGQTAELAPADGRIYAVRDVTATVESIGLIVASILSKKLAAGLDGLVIDVKTGNGAFMPTLERARELARSLVAVATGAGLPTTALLTDMNQVLGDNAGNALEVAEVIAFFSGRRREPRLAEIVMSLGQDMLLLAGLAAGRDDARDRLQQVLDDGSAADVFAHMVRALGGPADLLQRPDAHLPRAPVVLSVPGERTGYLSAIDTRALGLAVIALGGGRLRPDQAIDHAVGLTEVAALGARVECNDHGRPLARIHARDQAAADTAAAALRQAMTVSEEPPSVAECVRERLGHAATENASHDQPDRRG